MEQTEQRARERLARYSPPPEFPRDKDKTVPIFEGLLDHAMSQEGRNVIISWILQQQVTVGGVEIERYRSKDNTPWGCDDYALHERARWWKANLFDACIDLHQLTLMT